MPELLQDPMLQTTPPPGVLRRTRALKGCSYDYQLEVSEELRRNSVRRLSEKHPDHIPVIFQKLKGSKIPDLQKPKVLAPRTFTFGNLASLIRRRIELQPGQALYMFVGNTALAPQAKLAELYITDRDADGILYVTYSGEEAFG
eukprot:TRINITY_DN9288_c1_g1_i1.p1 TRINITY_DN9288_c1_g1~~TRINITY_DN9288_c1_g1_i1.p1  ORF type:complete len:144 (+),score=19.43 TRINITY_DN9288_c1_g1_i1:185-616(+)